MRTLRLAAFMLVLMLPALAAALDTSTRAVSPVLAWSADDLAGFDEHWVHFKCVEGLEPALVGAQLVEDRGRDLGALNALLSGAAEIRRTFPGDRERFRAMKARGEGRGGGAGPDLSLWYDLRVEGGRAELAALINSLNALPEVEIAHPAAICEPAAILGDARREPLRTPDFTGLQDYLYDPPVGLDAPAAWSQAGGRGQGMRFIDVELGWVMNHEEFSALHNFYEGGASQNPAYYDHGTAVLGEIIGRDNGFGVTGFAPETQWGVVAITEGEWPNVPHYFFEAVDNLRAGDVWLIELQMYPPGKDATPMEWLQVNYDVIWTGCWSEGVVCVEAGANGSQNLDDASWGGVFDRDVRDSGAIMVAAGTPTGRVAEWFTNWGSRMDVHAWGSSIVTCGYGDYYTEGTLQTEYTANFGGTSGASPMVTGSALCLQGIALDHYGAPLPPQNLRALLHDTGVPHLDGNQEIGPRPDLEAAVQQLLTGTGAADLPQSGGISLRCDPNPFMESTTLRFQLPRAGEASLRVYDIGGRLLRTLDGGDTAAGEHSLIWNGRDAQGRRLSSGVYLLRLEMDGRVLDGRVVKVR